jgi:hypothetical protein
MFFGSLSFSFRFLGVWISENKFGLVGIFMSTMLMIGCGSQTEAVVNPTPEITPAQVMEMDEESDQAREEAIRDGE